MKILIYSESFVPTLGGLERNTISLCNALVDLGHTVTLLTPTKNPDKDNFSFGVVRSRNIIASIYQLSRNSLLIVNGGLSLKICLPALFLRKSFITIYQSSTLFSRNGGGRAANAKNGARAYVGSKAIISIGVSAYATSSLPKRWPKATLYNPVDRQLDACIQQTQSIAPVYDILFSGRVIEGKGIFILAQAISLLKKSHRDITCAIAGEGEGMKRLSEISRDQDLRIVFLGRLDQKHLIEAYASAKILVVPSSTHVEGNPLVIAEAISVGIPIIASNQPAMIEAVGVAGRIFKSGDAVDLASKIHELLNNKVEYVACRNNCRDARTKFGYSTYQVHLNEILSNLELNAIRR